MKLGQLTEVDIRKVWNHEQYDFSKWLSDEDNIQILGNTLNLSLTDVETEKFVGNYRCDILCKDEITGKAVLIENQLEPTNHDHLGKIITYSSGLDASVVVWIVSSAREEHASAIEWLNKHTDDEFYLYFDEFYLYKDEIEKSCGIQLFWDRLEDKKASLICTYIPNLDFDNIANYPELINKAIDLVLKLKRAFVPYLK